MLFNSFDFLVFFIITTIAFFAFPHKYRWFLLLVASSIFYMYFIPIYILILFLTIVVDYFAGIWLERVQGERKKWYLIASIITNVGILGFFKYYNFFIDNINAIGGFLNPGHIPVSYLPIILPIGLSFHTFQAMSYTIEVYRGNQKAERHFGIYALYVMFYPQLVAGPIERPRNMLHQFHEEHSFKYDNLFSGLRWMLWGLFKKIVIADRLAILVDQVYNQPGHAGGMEWLIATVLFAIQIYCDFSGYSDIALGSARVMGFDLMVNFRQPYFSRSISEFWSRWHISLSTWFKDYLYIPLGGNRVKIRRWYFNLFIVFLVSGFWHGANWTFIIWGALHGLYLVLAEVRKRYWKGLSYPNFIHTLITFALVTFAWIFFRANSVQQAFEICKELFNVNASDYFHIAKIDLHGQPYSYLGLAKWKFIASLLVLPILWLADYLISSGRLSQILKQSNWVTWPLYYLLVIGILLFGVFETHQFIYFQF